MSRIASGLPRTGRSRSIAPRNSPLVESDSPEWASALRTRRCLNGVRRCAHTMHAACSNLSRVAEHRSSTCAARWRTTGTTTPSVRWYASLSVLGALVRETHQTGGFAASDAPHESPRTTITNDPPVGRAGQTPSKRSFQIRRACRRPPSEFDLGPVQVESRGGAPSAGLPGHASRVVLDQTNSDGLGRLHQIQLA